MANSEIFKQFTVAGMGVRMGGKDERWAEERNKSKIMKSVISINIWYIYYFLSLTYESNYL